MRHVMIAWVCVVAACPGRPGDPEAETETGDAPDTGTSTEPGTTTMMEPPTTSGESSSGAAPACGDGVVDAGESCDDGNGVDGDGCNNDCEASARLLWESLSGLRGDEVYLDVEPAPDGTLLVGGVRSPAAMAQDRWLLRFDLAGNLLWERSYDGSAAGETIFAVAQRGDAMFAAGSKWSDEGAWDLWVGRLDLQGEVVWEETVATPGRDYATGMALTAAGDVVVTGEVSHEQGVFVWTRQYAADGAVQWTRTEPVLKKPTYYFGPSVAIAGDGSLRVGFASDTDTFHELLLAYPPGGGEPLWQQSETTDGMVLGVALLGADVVTTGERYEDKLFVRRVTAGGATAWESQACVGEVGRAVAVDKQGDVVVIGYGPGDIATNVRLCKFSSDGALRWGKDLEGGFGHDLGHAVTVLDDGRIVAAGVMGQPGEAADGWLAMFAP
jgi:cysteine-rich repeat protein